MRWGTLDSRIKVVKTPRVTWWKKTAQLLVIDCYVYSSVSSYNQFSTDYSPNDLLEPRDSNIIFNRILRHIPPLKFEPLKILPLHLNFPPKDIKK